MHLLPSRRRAKDSKRLAHEIMQAFESRRVLNDVPKNHQSTHVELTEDMPFEMVVLEVLLDSTTGAQVEVLGNHGCILRKDLLTYCA